MEAETVMGIWIRLRMLSGSVHAHQSSDFLDCPAGYEVLERDGHAVLILRDADDFRAVSGRVGDPPRERLADTELDEGLERRPRTAAVIQSRVIMMGNAPRPGIDVVARVKLAMLVAPPSSV
jgi:hypothetical protein